MCFVLFFFVLFFFSQPFLKSQYTSHVPLFWLSLRGKTSPHWKCDEVNNWNSCMYTSVIFYILKKAALSGPSAASCCWAAMNCAQMRSQSQKWFTWSNRKWNGKKRKQIACSCVCILGVYTGMHTRTDLLIKYLLISSEVKAEWV